MARASLLTTQKSQIAKWVCHPETLEFPADPLGRVMLEACELMPFYAAWCHGIDHRAPSNLEGSKKMTSARVKGKLFQRLKVSVAHPVE